MALDLRVAFNNFGVLLPFCFFLKGFVFVCSRRNCAGSLLYLRSVVPFSSRPPLLVLQLGCHIVGSLLINDIQFIGSFPYFSAASKGFNSLLSASFLGELRGHCRASSCREYVLIPLEILPLPVALKFISLSFP